MATHTVTHEEQAVKIPYQTILLDGDLTTVPNLRGVVLFSHGSGSSRLSVRNRWVAGKLHESGFATLLMDLLTSEEKKVDNRTRDLRLDFELLAQRLVSATDWLQTNESTRALSSIKRWPPGSRSQCPSACPCSYTTDNWRS